MKRTTRALAALTLAAGIALTGTLPAQAAPVVAAPTVSAFGPSTGQHVTGWVWGCRRPWYLFGGETCGVYWKW